MLAYFLISCIVVAVVYWLARTNIEPSKEQQRTPVTIEASRLDGNQLTAKQAAHFQALNDHPIFRTIKPMLANGDWNGARLFLQKCAYGIKQQSAEEQQNFKEIMTAFASSDPLYRMCLDSVLPIIQENPGIKQTALYAHMTAAPDAEIARYVLYFADELGDVVRRKKGNSYLVFPAGFVIPDEPVKKRRKT